ncbi:uncharacterized protein LOC123522901 [Mercenaria mercenaria]|uniref:uncharacterized protein LOC123522901 n=1 Tax=Mercenaria mercenaria TaxID=6596 RepID=UPI00234F437D|nr:uncharacterized protein LOC123522901 [Mercenaria mercenaria]XP_045156344.2 uncharacterized protein LOC123522901 [Mercenaria mercenaria]
MFQAPEYTQTVSARLSEVLADIGVDERVVLKRRRTCLLNESMGIILGTNPFSSVYLVGSRSEGTTTLGFNSDIDVLTSCHNFNIIQDLSHWQPGVINHLMIQDETVSPGHCLLQSLRSDVPLPFFDCVLNKYHVKDRAGRILLTNRIISDITKAMVRLFRWEEGVQHGPAVTPPRQPSGYDIDYVNAYPCKSWPQQARQWLNQQGVGQWPSYDMRRYCSRTGCFVVGVGNKNGDKEEFEWRISTSLAERCLMFNLNITQIRCYVLMKMISKTYIKPHYEDTISSFMCKTVLFKVIANTHSNFWKENNLLSCLSMCLFVLYNCILNQNCPHFIIPGNNLMVGHINHESKPHLLEIMQYIIHSEGKALLGIECDDLCARLMTKLNNLICPYKTSDVVTGNLLKQTAVDITINIRPCLSFISNASYEVAIGTLLRYLFKLVTASNQRQGLARTACSLLAPSFCTTIGSILASFSIQQYNGISEEALTWISLGLNTDVSSGKLKLASMFYCIGDSQRTEIVLGNIEGSYDHNIVEPICGCYNYIHRPKRRGFNALSANHNEEALQYNAAFCVKFLPCEINCIPSELQYELFRSTGEDLAFRRIHDYWMNWAVVDSLSFLYFLQYKTYRYLERQDDKQRALSNLIRTIDQEKNLGHRETALNLLGQCMEHENRAADALHYYSLSLNVRERNNAAKIHICRLLSTLVNDHARNQ